MLTVLGAGLAVSLGEGLGCLRKGLGSLRNLLRMGVTSEGVL